ncbi:MAG: 2-oxoacid ferredoxin oxidoreductase [Omnitrophica WOR_2 bacterium RIFOXYC2_FULL_43_9]|nr:MAG: 2-oxoacid ferredoxin oxidoreductase [Omnitrophica WOR_2 bacterium RIFOXYC2_FULL_43_9]
MVDLNTFGKFETAWCSGCGNFGILDAVKDALVKLNLDAHNIVLVSGIGQAAKLPHYLYGNVFNGLHGRAIPAATGIKIANHKLVVIVTSGDGDIYGEGGNHFIHAIRRNIDITVIVHNNQVYALTKGQASPTSDVGYVTKVQTHGVIDAPVHPLTLAIALEAGFVARGFAGDKEHLSLMIQEGIQHKGFSLIDTLQWCVTFNKKNNFAWYKQRAYKLGPEYEPSDKVKAFEKSLEWGDKIPIGIIYRNGRPSYEEACGLIKDKPLVEQESSAHKVKTILKEFL